MTLPPVKLLRPDGLQIDADTPCILEVNIPITLPHQLDPSLPAPPYHNRDGGPEDEIVFEVRESSGFLTTRYIKHMVADRLRGALS
ncbi:uncharacterized protein C8A04DRAFT_32660 [Dichotomopilus funicola]|uniref:Uncharacterized protein n=1 Tax=Dichotomopilus funicola TaxID=1934379 RepID=A0AAN6UVK3_9PEZI|nr:hypothetical protein C8A04DRAFT_32660 [Dichotomopilus funicola]